MVRPKKHLGQHFLTDPAIAKRITDSLKRTEIQDVLEIGPGKGILTSQLLEDSRVHLVPVEIDPESVDYLRVQFPTLEKHLMEGDFLQINLDKIFSGPFRIIGNFPYNISSQIFFRVLEYREKVGEVVCMIQKEVALRIAAPPGSRTYGILSVLLQTWYRIEYLFTVQPGSFFPRPEVHSAVIRLTRNERVDLGADPALYTRLVKLAFNQRRKMLRNSLKGMIPADKMNDPVFMKRPEQLSVEDFIGLAKRVSS